MINKLKDIISHYDLLEKQMVDPDLVNNQNRYTELAKEPVSYTHLTLPTTPYV